MELIQINPRKISLIIDWTTPLLEDQPDPSETSPIGA